MGRDTDCAVLADDHSLRCWRAGDATTVHPVPVPGLVVQVDSKFSHACAVTVEGSVYCWGENPSHELGVPAPKHSDVPVRVPGVSLAVKRTQRLKGDERSVSVFAVEIALPEKPRQRTDDKGVAALEAEALAVSSRGSPEEALEKLDAASRRCRDRGCSPGLHAGIWRDRGEILAVAGKHDESVEAFAAALLLDPAIVAAGEGARRAFEAARKRPAPELLSPLTIVSGRLDPELVRSRIRATEGSLRFCYGAALRERPDLAGRLAVRFVVDAEGTIQQVTSGGSTLPSPEAVTCMVRSFEALSIPPPPRGIVTISHNVTLAPPKSGAPR